MLNEGREKFYVAQEVAQIQCSKQFNLGQRVTDKIPISRHKDPGYQVTEGRGFLFGEEEDYV